MGHNPRKDDSQMERKVYSEAFKREAVRKCELRGERSVGEVASELGVGPKHIYNWRRTYADVVVAAREEKGETLEEEVKRLRKENRELREEHTILKKATAFFAKAQGR